MTSQRDNPAENECQCKDGITGPGDQWVLLVHLGEKQDVEQKEILEQLVYQDYLDHRVDEDLKDNKEYKDQLDRMDQLDHRDQLDRLDHRD